MLPLPGMSMPGITGLYTGTAKPVSSISETLGLLLVAHVS